MKKYKHVEVSELQLEDFIRQGSDLIEEGLVFVDRQRMTDRGPLDLLMVDSGGSVVLAELKIHEEDGMLMQALDYYDWVARNVEAFSRLYKDHKIKPTQTPRLLLIAPSFSNTLLNRCKWLDVPITLFTFKCLQFEGESDIVPVFLEQALLLPPVIIEAATVEGNLDYITNEPFRKMATKVLDEIKSWSPSKITIDAIKHDISLKVSGRLFAYLMPRRQFFLIATYDLEDVWSHHAVNEEADWPPTRDLIIRNVEKLGNLTLSVIESVDEKEKK